MKHFPALLFLIMLPAAETSASVGPPPLFYPLPGFIDFSYQPPAYSEIHYGTKDRYALLLNQYLPKPPTEPHALSNVQNLTYLDDEKLRFTDTARQMFEDVGIDATLLQHRRDRRYYYFHGNTPVCISNNSTSALAFLRAVLADSQVEKEAYLQLALIRLALFDICYSAKPKQPDAVSQMIDMLPANAKPYGAYLQASAHFYLGEYEQALPIYRQLSEYSETGWLSAIRKRLPGQNSASGIAASWLQSAGSGESSWLKETSAYMVGRCQLIMAQKNWDGYSSPDKVEKTLLEEARRSFAEYLNSYPNGLCRNSAAGFERKIAYLGADRSGLNRMLKQQASDALATASRDRKAIPAAYESLIEFRRFYTGEADYGHDHPLLVAYHLMDQQSFGDDVIAVLERRKQDFAPYRGLFEFALALVNFRQGRFETLTNDAAAQSITGDAASLAAAVLRAQALAAVGNSNEAILVWRQINALIKDDIAQLHLAGLYAQTNDYVHLLGSDGGIANPRIKADFLHFALDTRTLETLQKDRSMADDAHHIVNQELLRRHLLTGQFRALSNLLEADAPPPYDSIRKAARRLAVNANDADSLAEIGLFIYERHITPDSQPQGLDNVFETSGLEDLAPYCPSCKQHGERTRIMQSAYEYLGKSASIYKNRRKKTAYEAEVLHTLTQCFRGTEYRHRCQWDRTYKNTSKQWFDRLHALYPKSEWAHKTPYYY